MPTELEDDLIPQPRGIVEELVRDDVGRKKFLKAVGTAGAASFGAFVLAACGSSSSTTTTKTSAPAKAPVTPAASSVPASFGAGDIGILNYALTLEYLEEQFYAKVIAAKLFTGAVGSLVAEFGQQESEHVAAIHQTVLAAALSIHTVEARHAATLATLVPGGHVTPTGAFATPDDAATVLAAVKPFIA